MTTLPLQDLKLGARKSWSEGDYSALARFLPPAAGHLVRAAGVGAGDTVLDIACGTGITAITAARAGAQVHGLDLTPDLLAIAAREAAVAGVSVAWKEGDAEAMEYPDASFDVVLSSFGHMFTPDPRAAAAEMVRVAKPGGRIAFVTWPPASVVGQMLQAVGAVLPPPPGAQSPVLWGVEETVAARLGDVVTDLRFERGTIAWPTTGPATLWHLFGRAYGPFITALGKLEGEPEKQETLARSVQAVFAEHIQDNVVPFEYLLTQATKR